MNVEDEAVIQRFLVTTFSDTGIQGAFCRISHSRKCTAGKHGKGDGGVKRSKLEKGGRGRWGCDRIATQGSKSQGRERGEDNLHTQLKPRSVFELVETIPESVIECGHGGQRVTSRMLNQRIVMRRCCGFVTHGTPSALSITGGGERFFLFSFLSFFFFSLLDNTTKYHGRAS